MLIYSFITDYQAFNLRYKDNTTRDKNETKVDKQSANLGKNNEPIQNRLSFLIDCKSVILHHLAILSFPMVRPAWDNLFIAEFCRRNKKKGLNMKVITMESSAYKEMMAQIANIAGYIREARDEKKRKRETEDKLLDTAQAAKMLNVSKRTMQRMRTDHRIEYVVVRGSCRYRLSEILRLLEDNTVRNEEGTIDTLFHNHTLRTGGKPKGRRT